MTNCDIACSLWRDINAHRWEALPGYFAPDAAIHWPNTGESFSVTDFVRANAEYPGDWAITIRLAHELEKGAVTIIQASQASTGLSFHACSFFYMEEGKILRLEEYWGEDCPPPQWRVDRGIGIGGN